MKDCDKGDDDRERAPHKEKSGQLMGGKYFPRNYIHSPEILNTYTPLKKNRQQLSRLEAKQRRAGKAGKATRDEMLAVMKKQAVSRQHCRLTICMGLDELTNSIRQQDPNIYSDTEARYLV